MLYASPAGNLSGAEVLFAAGNYLALPSIVGMAIKIQWGFWPGMAR
jgi:hypothetical protein